MSSKAQLKPNPFSTYRDPATGRWIVVQPASLPSTVNVSIVSPSDRDAEIPLGLSPFGFDLENWL